MTPNLWLFLRFTGYPSDFGGAPRPGYPGDLAGSPRPPVVVPPLAMGPPFGEGGTSERISRKKLHNNEGRKKTCIKGHMTVWVKKILAETKSVNF